MKEILEYKIVHFNNVSITVWSIVAAATLLIANYFLVKAISLLIIRYLKKHGNADGRHHSITQLVGYFLWTLAIVLSLQLVGLDVTFLIASSAALLVGIGIGMQIIFKDFMSGIILLVEGTIKVGDIVEIENQIVKVKEISLRTSRVINRDDKVVIVPNHKFIEDNVINWTHSANPTRFIIDVGVDYTSDVHLVEKLLLEAAAKSPDIIKTEPHKAFVRFNNFGGSALEFQLIFWSTNLFRVENSKSNIRYDITELFRQANITIPFAQMVIHRAKD